MTNTTTLKIGTRGSKLALWQARHVSALLEQRFPELDVELEIIKTTGDRILDKPLAEIGGKGLFLKEIEDAMLAGKVDLAVHSMKDVPAVMPQGLVLAAMLPREDPRDAFIGRDVHQLSMLPDGATVGTSSLRRTCQLKFQLPNLNLVPLRGNVDTRLAKVEDPDQGLDAIILAAAGLIRLGLSNRIGEIIDPKQMLPAVGQGAIGIEIRQGDQHVLPFVAALNDRKTWACVSAERAFLYSIGGDCKSPIAAHATLGDDNTISLVAMVGRVDGSALLRMSAVGDDPQSLGQKLALEMLDAGAEHLLKENLE